MEERDVEVGSSIKPGGVEVSISSDLTSYQEHMKPVERSIGYKVYKVFKAEGGNPINFYRDKPIGTLSNIQGKKATVWFDSSEYSKVVDMLVVEPVFNLRMRYLLYFKARLK